MSTSTNHQLFPALLRYWRTRRGLSQLELALESDVSARHISFLESGRARPSEEMVLRLFTVMSVPLSDQNQALAAAGFEARFPSPPADALAPEVDQALAQMMAQHEPFPLAVLSVDGVILRQNMGASRLFQAFIASPDAVPDPLDMFSLLSIFASCARSSSIGSRLREASRRVCIASTSTVVTRALAP